MRKLDLSRLCTTLARTGTILSVVREVTRIKIILKCRIIISNLERAKVLVKLDVCCISFFIFVFGDTLNPPQKKQTNKKQYAL